MATIAEVVLRNFKSFRSARAPLESNFVCIVGANGAGKSNLIDSIRFAFGESSLRALRAHRVQDLIYTGSKSALIKVVIKCNGESTEIVRLIRADGRTKYKLNGRRVTRSTVLEFLRSSGIGLGEQNIIAQGEVERIVRMTPRERREIIDEIAGIKEFEEKKKEALSELDRVQQKINEASIVLREKEGFLLELEKERNAALRYNELKELLQRAKGTILHLELKRVEKEIEKISKKAEELEREQRTVSEQIESINKQIESAEVKRAEINARIASRAHQKLYSEVESLRARVAADSTILEEKVGALKKLRATIAQLEAEEKEVGEKISKLTMEARESAARAVELKNTILQLSAQRSKIISEWAERRKRFDEIKDEIARRENELREIRERIEALRARQSAIPELVAAKEALDKLIVQQEAKKKRIGEIDEEVLRIKEELARVRASGGVKFDIEGVYGSVCELYEVDAKYAIACAAAAGARAGWIVVENVAKAIECIDLLKKSGGFATFIPLDVKLAGGGSESEGAGWGGGENKGEGGRRARRPPSWSLGHVISFMRFDDKFARIFDYIFGDTLLVEGTAQLARARAEGWRAVTLDGDIIERSGVVSGGRRRKPPEALAKEADALAKEKESLLVELSVLEKAILSARRKVIEGELRIGAAAEAAAAEVGERDIVELEEDAREVERALLELCGERERLRAALERGEDEAERGAIDAKLMELKAELARLTARADGEGAALLHERAAQIARALREARDEERGLSKEVKELRARVDGRGRELAEKESALAAEGAELERAFAESKALQATIDGLASERGRCVKKAERLKEEAIRIDVQRDGLRTRCADLKAELAAYEGIAPLSGDHAEIEDVVRSAEAELAAIGTVNLKAPEVWATKKAEYDELARAVATLTQERAAVLKVIDELEGRKKDVFTRTFAAVAQHFSQIARAMGQLAAELVLEKPESPLEGGLNINARFEVKGRPRERPIETMSGGERTLLAIAFVFALHMYRPAPFYILDEVEAALDKENSKKFVAMLDELAQNTQFILVTHNDAVIPAADVALGITRTPRGSRIVSVKLAA